MLKLIDIKKSYGDVQALKGLNIEFRQKEFVSILGPSGCGKTTLLNIVGGLDRYSSGDLVIKGTSTTEFSDRDWDAYRNQSVGFVFQSYNLIPHLTVFENVELAMKLTGQSKSERKEKAEDVLIRVGLKDHLHKRPNQLSGGQMQRVAIARALVNDPEIILADEPTGALDSETSLVVMDLLHEIAADRLVIMVTHNQELAEKYSTRIVSLLDGEILSDTNPYQEVQEFSSLEQVKTSMPYVEALRLSGRNLWAKKGRTMLTSFAGSIGIIGIALILALSTGMQGTIDNLQQDTLASSPITIEPQTIDFMSQGPVQPESPEYPDNSVITGFENHRDSLFIKNNITQEYIDYVSKLDPSTYVSLKMAQAMNFTFVSSTDKMLSKDDLAFGSLLDDQTYHDSNFDMLSGKMPSTNQELVLVVDAYNRLPQELIDYLEINNADEALGKILKFVPNDTLYQEVGNVFIGQAVEYNTDSLIELEIVGVMRKKESSTLDFYNSGIYGTSGVEANLLDINKNSKIVEKQIEVGQAYSVLNGQPFNDQMTYEQTLEYLGGPVLPSKIEIIPRDFENKKLVLTYLDAFNEGKEKEDQVIYQDLSAIITKSMETVVNTVSYVLIAFSSISLVVSSLMIGIITYVSVIERTKEIGVLRSLGARKKDISRVFNAETLLVGFVAGSFGVLFTYLVSIPINSLIKELTQAENVAALNPVHALILILISIGLTWIAGLIPSRMAAKKDPVVALRSE